MWIRLGVRLVSWIWSLASAFAFVLTKVGLLRSAHLEARVVSIGNLQAGGAGKTPLIMELAREAIGRGQTVCILCRGYRGNWEHSGGGVIEPHAKGVKVSDCGDEAALLHERVPEAWIGVGANRVEQFRKIEKAAKKVDLVLLDDGFQHWKIKKDLEVLAVTSAKRDEVFHRNWLSAIKRADLLVWTKGKSEPDSWRMASERQVPRVRVEFEIPRPKSRSSYWLVTGVGDSSAVRSQVEAAGYNLKDHLAFGDHEDYSLKVVKGILTAAKKEKVKVLITGKDWVKWRSLGVAKTDVDVIEPKVLFQANEGADTKQVWDQIVWGD